MDSITEYINYLPGTPTVHTYANMNGGYDIVLNLDGGYAELDDAERIAQFTTEQLKARGLRVQHAAQ